MDIINERRFREIVEEIVCKELENRYSDDDIDTILRKIFLLEEKIKCLEEDARRK